MAIVFFAPAVLLGTLSAALVIQMGGTVLLAMLAYSIGGAVGIFGLAMVVYFWSLARDGAMQSVSLAWPIGHAAQGGAISMVPQQD